MQVKIPNSSYAPLVRIALRWLAGFTGGLSYAHDAELVAALCVVVGVLVEATYTFARRKGWAT